MNGFDSNQVIISGFADEIAEDKDLDQQFSVVAALGMEYFSIRFVRVDGQIKNIVTLDATELTEVKQKIDQYGLNVSSLGSPIGKVKLVDVDDGTSNQFVPFSEYLEKHVKPACEIATKLNTRLVRGFSFYHPKGGDAHEHLNQTTDQLGSIVEMCASFDLVFGLEVEANLVGHTGKLLAGIHSQVNHPNLVLIFDGGNLVTQGFNSEQVFDEYLAMKPGLGWIHVKDYLPDSTNQLGTYVDEEALSRFVPVEQGASGYEKVWKDLKTDDSIFQRQRALKLPGLFVDLEPHLKGGGQFGGFSGPDGFGLAFRSLCNQLDQVNLHYDLRSLDRIKRSMGS